ncbi:hypothetical protein [Pseudoneobacillus sp. C159]
MRGILLRALECQTPLELIYISKDGSISQRFIRLKEIQDDQIVAYCLLRKKYRMFKLSNILAITPVRKKYKGA